MSQSPPSNKTSRKTFNDFGMEYESMEDSMEQPVENIDEGTETLRLLTKTRIQARNFLKTRFY